MQALADAEVLLGRTPGDIIVTQQLSNVTNTRTVDAFGNPTAPIPGDAYQFLNPTGFEQRKFQLGFRVAF